MSLEDLKQRYLTITKNALSFLKEEGFQKKGMKYSKQKGNFILKIHPLVPRAYLNDEHSYEFEILWDIMSTDPELIQLYLFMGSKKNIQEVSLVGSNILPKALEGQYYLTDKDSPRFDENYIEGVQDEIKTVILPLFNQIKSVDDVIPLAEEEAKVEQDKRVFFPFAIYPKLARLYAYKGWKEKTLEMCDKHLERMTTPGSRKLVEEEKKKYIQYFELKAPF